MTLDLSARRVNSLASSAGSARSLRDPNLTTLPDAVKLIFRGRPSAVERAGEAFGISLPLEPCRFATNKSRSVFWLGPDEWMLQTVGESETTLMSDLRQALAGQSCSLVDISHRSDAFAISGAQSAYLLNHGCPLDLSLDAFPVGMCTRTVFAKATILLSRWEQNIFQIDVWRSFAPYVWELLDEARGEFV